ncbi:ATP-grasp domain-containing protein [Actinomadura chibensis]|uniref:ATP-grasp domain-containing protein n=1 Tax=Actinomadura chibensis TaxID=392828 RepID=A0A5D0NQH3_9ACTN|nr:ATP-grasp domain-containing protein [Actinomadura chibensis]TYB46388.1 ATP-grasp domain-containing protein [Actinomadura chibensis]
MKLGVLGWSAREAESIGIADAARDRGHDVLLFELADIGCLDGPTGIKPTIAGVDAREIDVVVSRAHVGRDNWRDAVERLLLLSSVPGLVVLDHPVDHVAVVSKLAMLQNLSRSGIPIPPTRLCASLTDLEQAAKEWGAVVVKPSVGHRGIDVERFCEGVGEAAKPRLEELLTRYGSLLCQPYLPHQGDWRIHVIDGQATMCVRLQTDGTDLWKPLTGFESGKNILAPLEVTTAGEDIVELAVRAAQAVGLSMAGIDIIHHEGKPVVIEANSCPAWGFLDPPLQRVRNTEVVELAERRLAALPQTERNAR